MSWQAFIFSRLSGDTTIQGLVDNGATDRIRYRIFPAGTVPEIDATGATNAGALPRIIYQKISGMPGYTNDGQDELTKYRIQIDAWAETRTGATALGDAIRARGLLSGYRDLQGNVASTKIAACFVEDQRDDDEPLPGQEARIFRDSTDFILWVQA